MNQLIIRKRIADQIKEGMFVKTVRNLSGIVVTKTNEMITVLTEEGCFDYKIVK